MTTTDPNPADVKTFFEAIIPDQIHLTAITPDGGTTAHDFGTDAEAAAGWAIRQNLAGKNIHWTVNRVRPGVNRKPSKTDIVAIRFAHADVDPPKRFNVPYPITKPALKRLINSYGGILWPKEIAAVFTAIESFAKYVANNHDWDMPFRPFPMGTLDCVAVLRPVVAKGGVGPVSVGT